eukprot:359965-Chlamydomonas_euryale.AAC.2
MPGQLASLRGVGRVRLWGLIRLPAGLHAFLSRPAIPTNCRATRALMACCSCSPHTSLLEHLQRCRTWYTGSMPLHQRMPMPQPGCAVTAAGGGTGRRAKQRGSRQQRRLEAHLGAGMQPRERQHSMADVWSCSNRLPPQAMRCRRSSRPPNLLSLCSLHDVTRSPVAKARIHTWTRDLSGVLPCPLEHRQPSASRPSTPIHTYPYQPTAMHTRIHPIIDQPKHCSSVTMCFS